MEENPNVNEDRACADAGACAHVRSAGPSPRPASCRSAARPGRSVSWTKLVPNVLSDQKQIWTFPTKLGKRKYWIPAVAVVGVTAGLVALDPKTAGYFRRSSSFDGFNRAFSGRATRYRKHRGSRVAVRRGIDSQRFENAIDRAAGRRSDRQRGNPDDGDERHRPALAPERHTAEWRFLRLMVPGQ